MSAPASHDPVTQADIEAAIDLKYTLDSAGSTTWSARTAKPHEHPVARAFAAHRLAALASPVVGVEEMREAAAQVARGATGYDDALQRAAGCLTVGERIAAAILNLPLPAAPSAGEGQPTPAAGTHEAPVPMPAAVHLAGGGASSADAPGLSSTTDAPAIPAGMVAWAGGEKAPEDWDETKPVKWAVPDRGYVSEGLKMTDHPWKHGVPGWYDIIAYTPRPTTDPERSSEVGADLVEAREAVAAMPMFADVADAVKKGHYDQRYGIIPATMQAICAKRAALRAPADDGGRA